MKKLLLLIGTAMFLHQGVGESAEISQTNTPENNSEENESDVQPEAPEEVAEEVDATEESSEDPA